MRVGRAGIVVLLAIACGGARGQGYVPDGAVMLFDPGSAAISQEARDALLAFLRPPRPVEFRGHCVAGHADRGAEAGALSLARAHAVAAMMLRQGVDAGDIAVAAHGDAAPARLAPAGRAEAMNDRVELLPCPGPRLAGVTEAQARALDAAVLPGFVAALAPRLARALGCAEPEVARGALAPPPLDCPDAPVLTVLRLAGTRRVAVTLEWPAGFGADADRWRAPAATVLDLFGHAPAGPVLAALAAGVGAARRMEFLAGGVRAEVEAGPGLLRRLRVVPAAGDGP